MTQERDAEDRRRGGVVRQVVLYSTHHHRGLGGSWSALNGWETADGQTFRSLAAALRHAESFRATAPA